MVNAGNCHKPAPSNDANGGHFRECVGRGTSTYQPKGCFGCSFCLREGELSHGVFRQLSAIEGILIDQEVFAYERGSRTNCPCLFAYLASLNAWHQNALQIRLFQLFNNGFYQLCLDTFRNCTFNYNGLEIHYRKRRDN